MKPISRFRRSDIPANRRFPNRMFRKFHPDPFVDPVTGVPLFPWCLPIRLQHLVDKSHHRLQPGLLPLRALPRRGHGVAQGLPHHPPMHPQFPGHTLDRSHTKLVLSPDLFK